MDETFVSLPLINREAPNVISVMDGILMGQQEFREKTSHYPSGARIVTDEQIIGTCIRKQFYSWRGETESEIDIGGLWKMDMGNAIHDWIANRLNKSFTVNSEYTVEYHPDFLKYPVRGRIDNLITTEDGNHFGIEIKSGYGAGMTNRASGVKHFGPKEEHLLQALIYLYISRLSDEEKAQYMPENEEKNRPFVLPSLDYFILYYIARDDAYRTAFYVDIVKGETVVEYMQGTLTEERLEVIKDLSYVPVITDGSTIYIREDISFRKIIESFMTVEKYVETGKTPPRDYFLSFDIVPNENELFGIELKIDRKASDWQCSYCTFNKICYIRDAML